MRFILEVDMGKDGFGGNAEKELGRVLRYWGGQLNYFKLVPGDGATIMDSSYTEVGSWRIEAEPGDAVEAPS